MFLRFPIRKQSFSYSYFRSSEFPLVPFCFHGIQFCAVVHLLCLKSDWLARWLNQSANQQRKTELKQTLRESIPEYSFEDHTHPGQWQCLGLAWALTPVFIEPVSHEFTLYMQVGFTLFHVCISHTKIQPAIPRCLFLVAEARIHGRVWMVYIRYVLANTRTSPAGLKHLY